MTLTTRRLNGQEMIDALYNLTQYSLDPSPPFQNKDEWTALYALRHGFICHAVLEDDIAQSVAVSTAMTQNMRGALYPACGVWGVATAPSARRKGYCRQAIASLLVEEHEQGKVFSNLYPFRESFYEKMGYVSFPLTRKAILALRNLAPLLKTDSAGEIELQPIGAAFESYRAYIAEMRAERHGMAFFDFGDQAAANRNTLWAALAKFDGKIEGLMLYRITGEEPTEFHLTAYRFYYHTIRARLQLLNWLARHIDQASQAEIWLTADEIPESWYADLEIKSESATRAAMSRVLDVAKIGGMQVGAGGFNARISDPLCPWNEGVWRFEEQDGRLLVSPAQEGDCNLTIQGLTALVAGTHDPQELELRGWGDPDPRLQATLRTMFPRLWPYLHENF